jgi:hypothetical protein
LIVLGYTIAMSAGKIRSGRPKNKAIGKTTNLSRIITWLDEVGAWDTNETSIGVNCKIPTSNRVVDDRFLYGGGPIVICSGRISGGVFIPVNGVESTTIRCKIGNDHFTALVCRKLEVVGSAISVTIITKETIIFGFSFFP